ncbi:MAG: Peptidylprolyl isomerase, partial [Verrucomicrobia bacterium]|nr:Peptidylprolyl isomerase [Verrucomicrobiota bacterium]
GLRHDSAGMLSMANDGPDTNGSQFFFTLREVNRLNYLHSVFGKVVRGIELLPLIKPDDMMSEVNILRVGAAAKAFRADQATFSSLVASTKKFSGPATPGPAAHFDDPDKILPTEPPRALAFQRKLANFERATGRKIYARILARFEPATPKQSPGRFAESIARKIGLGADSALAIYFAESDQWAFWIGDDYLPQFTGAGRDALSELMRSGGLHHVKETFLADAKAKSDLAIADYIRTAEPDKPITQAQRIKLQVDAVLDALIFKFEPPSQP